RSRIGEVNHTFSFSSRLPHQKEEEIGGVELDGVRTAVRTPSSSETFLRSARSQALCGDLLPTGKRNHPADDEHHRNRGSETSEGAAMSAEDRFNGAAKLSEQWRQRIEEEL